MRATRGPVPALRRAVVSVALASALLAAGASSASALAPTQAVFDQAMHVAYDHWGKMPCRGSIAYGWVSNDSNVVAVSTWTPGDLGDPYTDCRIDFNTQAEVDYPEFCSMVTHEMGHLLGHAHSDDPDDVMYGYYFQPMDACTVDDPGVTTVYGNNPPPVTPSDLFTPPAAARPLPAVSKKSAAKRGSGTGSRSAQARRGGAVKHKKKKHARRRVRKHH